jgi:glycine cleavage system T protein (aminomethyltransferase)
MRRTPLYAAHRALGARMVDFAGWEMPVQYRGILEEHAAVRTRVGLFDVSHMGEIEIRGDQAAAACQRVTCNDVARLRDGEAQYSLLLLPSGGVVDDVVVHRLRADRFLLCVNASNRERDAEWLSDQVSEAQVVDRSDEFAQLALQGPRATGLLARLTNLPLEKIARFHFSTAMVAGCTALVAHTGYTGEDGWELYCAPDKAEALWNALLEEGKTEGLIPAGLGARDTLRLEAALPLYGHELDEKTTPLEARLGWVVHFDKGDFIGKEALTAQQKAGLRRKLVGIGLTEPGVPRAGYAVLRDGTRSGEITSGTKSPTLGKGIGLGYVSASDGETGTRLAVDIRGRAVAAEVVPLPFYRRRE